MVKKLTNGLYQFKNGVLAKKRKNGQYRIVKGASKQYMNKIRKKRGGSNKKIKKKINKKNKKKGGDRYDLLNLTSELDLKQKLKKLAEQFKNGEITKVQYLRLKSCYIARENPKNKEKWVGC